MRRERAGIEKMDVWLTELMSECWTVVCSGQYLRGAQNFEMSDTGRGADYLIRLDVVSRGFGADVHVYEESLVGTDGENERLAAVVGSRLVLGTSAGEAEGIQKMAGESQ